MNASDALIRLKRGDSINCVTPEGIPFQVQVKLDKYVGLPWYRTRPAYERCGLKRYSRLSDRHMLEWLGNVTIYDDQKEVVMPYSELVQRAFRDWNESRAYLDNGGNYRVRSEAATPTHRPKGKIAPWNKEVKRLFASCAEFHAAAREARRLEPHTFEPWHWLTEICRHCDGGRYASCHTTAQASEKHKGA